MRRGFESHLGKTQFSHFKTQNVSEGTLPKKSRDMVRKYLSMPETKLISVSKKGPGIDLTDERVFVRFGFKMDF